MYIPAYLIHFEFKYFGATIITFKDIMLVWIGLPLLMLVVLSLLIDRVQEYYYDNLFSKKYYCYNCNKELSNNDIKHKLFDKVCKTCNTVVTKISGIK